MEDEEDEEEDTTESLDGSRDSRSYISSERDRRTAGIDTTISFKSMKSGDNSALAAEGEDSFMQSGAALASRRSSGVATSGILKSLATLAPFVPKMLKDSIAADADGKFAAFSTANLRDLVGASQTLAPSMVGTQLAVMIADVKGFTALTEILSKKGERSLILVQGRGRRTRFEGLSFDHFCFEGKKSLSPENVFCRDSLQARLAWSC